MSEARPFRDRTEAGRALAARLRGYAGRDDVRILALPRGGVPVAYEVASALEAPLDVIVVRKLGVPGHEELAMGAIASGGTCVLNVDVLRQLRLGDAAVERAIEREARELAGRERAYRGDRPMIDLSGRTVILVDDGLATGSTMRAAARAVARQRPARRVVATPVGAQATCDELARDVDEVVCLLTPEPFYAVGAWYVDFAQLTDAEIRELLARYRTTPRVAGVRDAEPPETYPSTL